MRRLSKEIIRSLGSIRSEKWKDQRLECEKNEKELQTQKKNP